MITTLIVHCAACNKTWDYELEPNQTLYGAAYIIGARHEAEYASEDCYLRAAKCIELVGIKEI